MTLRWRGQVTAGVWIFNSAKSTHEKVLRNFEVADDGKLRFHTATGEYTAGIIQWRATPWPEP